MKTNFNLKCLYTIEKVWAYQTQTESAEKLTRSQLALNRPIKIYKYQLL